MTCREKLAIEHPDMVGDDYFGGCCGCPFDLYYIDKPEYCYDSNIKRDERCTKCWDREIPGTENKEEVKEMETKTTKKTKAKLLNEIADLKKELENLDKYRQYENVADELAAMRDAFIAKGFTREEAMQFIFNAQNSIRL